LQTEIVAIRDWLSMIVQTHQVVLLPNSALHPLKDPISKTRRLLLERLHRITLPLLRTPAIYNPCKHNKAIVGHPRVVKPRLGRINQLCLEDSHFLRRLLGLPQILVSLSSLTIFSKAKLAAAHCQAVQDIVKPNTVNLSLPNRNLPSPNIVNHSLVNPNTLSRNLLSHNTANHNLVTRNMANHNILSLSILTLNKTLNQAKRHISHHLHLRESSIPMIAVSWTHQVAHRNTQTRIVV
jgi:hypothetical protein